MRRAALIVAVALLLAGLALTGVAGTQTHRKSLDPSGLGLSADSLARLGFMKGAEITRADLGSLYLLRDGNVDLAFLESAGIPCARTAGGQILVRVDSKEVHLALEERKLEFEPVLKPKTHARRTGASPALKSSGTKGGTRDTFDGSANPAIAIPDNAYNGSTASMASSVIDASAIPAGSTINSVTVDISATHTWVGDLVIKLQSPSGAILALMSRPGLAETADDGNGCCGNSANLDGASLVFGDSGANDAETMGNGLGTGDFVCTTDGRCSYFPNPGICAGLANFAGFNGQNPSGQWTLFIGDAGGGDTGNLASWQIHIDYTAGGPIPTVNPWGIAGLVLLLAGAGYFLVRRLF